MLQSKSEKLQKPKQTKKEMALEEEKNRRQRKPKRKEKFEFQSDNIDAESKDERRLATNQRKQWTEEEK